MSLKSKLLYLLLAGMLLSQACSIGQQPLSEDVVREEIVAFTLDFIVKNEIGGMADSIVNSGQPWVNSPPSASIIIYAPAMKNAEDPSKTVDSKHPITVWWYADNKLTRLDDKQKAIDEYVKKYVNNSASSNIFTWEIYKFGIMEVSSDGQSAEIYVIVECGRLCGSGEGYKLKRNSNGEWQIYGIVPSTPWAY